MNAEEKKAWEEMVDMANKVRPRNKHQDKMRKAILFAAAVIERAGDVDAMEAFLDGDESRSMRELAEKFSRWLMEGK